MSMKSSKICSSTLILESDSLLTVHTYDTTHGGRVTVRLSCMKEAVYLNPDHKSPNIDSSTIK